MLDELKGKQTIERVMQSKLGPTLSPKFMYISVGSNAQQQ